MKLISIVTPCYNEEENVAEVYNQVRNVFSKLSHYEYEHIFIDNASKDKTVEILKGIAGKDKNIKIIVNARNFGQIRSPFYAFLQAKGDAVIPLTCDLQEPTELIFKLITKWEEGFKIIAAVKNKSKESSIMFSLRKAYYNFIKNVAEVELIQNYYGFGLYDRKIVEVLRSVNDPYPYFRGLICEIGFEKAIVEFTQAKRERGLTKNNFFTLYDIAMQGLTSYSKVPLRIATMMGFVISILSILTAVVYFILKFIFWKYFSIGMAPLIIGVFFFSSVQLFFIGLLGEYIGAVYTQVQKRPLVIEKERINFDN